MAKELFADRLKQSMENKGLQTDRYHPDCRKTGCEAWKNAT